MPILGQRSGDRVVLGLIIAALTLAVGYRAHVQGATLPQSTGEANFALIDAYLVEQMAELRIAGLALGIVQGDTVVHLQAFGRADPTGRAVTPQTPFVLNSISKSFVALAIMQTVGAMGAANSIGTRHQRHA